MSIQSQINRIKANVASAYTAAQSKGATMPSSQNSANLAETINSISANQAADYVVEQRINSTGDVGTTQSSWGYRKWNSGRAECWLRYPVNGIACNTAVGSWYRTADLSFPNYPFSFLYHPNTQRYFETTSGTGGLVWTTGTSNTSAPTTRPTNAYVIRMTSATSLTGWINIYAVGRWK